MQNFIKYFIYTFFSCQLISQQAYRSVEEIESEWGGYTEYQREEMIAFCDFLFKEGHYERCLISSFKLLYKLENDPVIPLIHYYIARSYEEIEGFDLSIRYYKKILDSEDLNSKIFKSATYRIMHVKYLLGDYNQILNETEGVKDPYLLILRAYSLLREKKIEESRVTFIQAQSKFNHSHYNKLITPLYKAIEDAGSVKNYNKYSILLYGLLFPGGGQFALKDYDQAKGVIATFGLLMLTTKWGEVEKFGNNSEQFFYSEANSFPVINLKKKINGQDALPAKLNFSFSSNKYPPIILGISVLFSSAWSSFNKTNIKNSIFMDNFINNQLNIYPPSSFMDFYEPNLIEIN
jgi:tetratricopeptide (TPR) repeat protein